MIELTDVQAMALRTLMSRARGFLNTVECAPGASQAAVRDCIIDDCEQWISILLQKQSTQETRVRCEGCGNEIDPTTCHCGSPIEGHGHAPGHGPIPMGCDCGRAEMNRGV